MIRRILRRLVKPPPPPPSAPPAARTVPPEPEAVDFEVEEVVPGSLLVDIREPGEMAGGVAPGAMLLPMDLVPHHLSELPRDRPITLYCAAGVRSFGVAHWLRERGYDAWSFAPGVGGLGPLERRPGSGERVAIPAAVAGTAEDVQGERIDATSARFVDAQGYWVRVALVAG